MSTPTRVPYPLFELIGPPCETTGCKGVLVDHVNWKTDMFFRRCSLCSGEFHQVPASEKLAWSRRTIERVLNGEKSS